eukprot:1906292-Prymnesium_polylepis.1
MPRVPRRRVACACIALRLLLPAGPTRVSPRRHPREHPGPLRRTCGKLNKANSSGRAPPWGKWPAPTAQAPTKLCSRSKKMSWRS